MGTHLVGQTATQIYQKIVEVVIAKGEIVAKSRDLLDVSFELTDPRNNLVYVKKQHWIWCLYEGLERLDPDFLNPGRSWEFRPSWKRKLTAEGGKFCYTYNNRYSSQLQPVLERLRSKATREAVISVWDEDYTKHYKSFERTPCTLTHHFLIRDKRLHLFTSMRTNDIINLLPYDIWHHTTLQRWIAGQLGLQLGAYHHQVNHAYYQKKRDATGNIHRVIAELEKANRLPLNSEFDFPYNKTDLQSDFKLMRAALKPFSLRGSLNVEHHISQPFTQIKNTYLQDWTAVLLQAEAKRAGLIVRGLEGYKLSVPEFLFIS